MQHPSMNRTLVIRYIAPLIIALSTPACETKTDPHPPAATLEKGFKADFMSNDKIVGYKVKNFYKRQVKDEEFWVYEFDIQYISGWHQHNWKDNTPRPTQRTVGFVKRGNTWYHRPWNSND